MEDLIRSLIQQRMAQVLGRYGQQNPAAGQVIAPQGSPLPQQIKNMTSGGVSTEGGYEPYGMGAGQIGNFGIMDILSNPGNVLNAYKNKFAVLGKLFGLG